MRLFSLIEQLGYNHVSSCRGITSHRVSSIELSKHPCLDIACSSGSHQSLSLDSNDGRYLLGGCADGSITIHDLYSSLPCTSGNGRLPVAFVKRAAKNAHKYSVSCVRWLPQDCALFASGSTDKTVRVWDANAMCPVDSYPFATPIFQVDMSARAGRRPVIAVASGHSTIQLIDIVSGSAVHNLQGHQGPVITLQWSPRDAHILASGGNDGRVVLWDVRSGKSMLKSLSCRQLSQSSNIHARGLAHSGTVNGLQFSPDGLLLVSLGTEGLVKLWDSVKLVPKRTRFEGAILNQGKKAMDFGFSQEVDPARVFLPDGDDIAVFCVGSGRLLRKLHGHFQSVNSCIWRARLHELYSCANDKSLLAWIPKMDQTFGVGDVDDGGALGELDGVVGKEKVLDLTADNWSDEDDSGDGDIYSG